MSLRLVIALAGSAFAGVLALAGCSAGARGAASGSPAPAGRPPAASSSVAAPEAGSTAFADVKFTAGEGYQMFGQGCTPGTTVMIGIEASHASGRIIARGTATSSGTFSISYVLPYVGEPTAELSATCLSPAGQQITAQDTPFTYARDIPGSGDVKMTAGKGYKISGRGCKPGTTVSIGIEASHASGRTIAQGTATSSGTFSISYVLPFAGQPEAELSATCLSPAGQQITAQDTPFTYARDTSGS